MRWVAAVIWLCIAVPALAQSASDAAEAARVRLGEARELLNEAETRADRIAALTETIQAYESGLSAMREGLRQVAIREQAIAADLAAREAEIADLLGVISAISSAPRPLLLLHPSGPAGTARAAMLLSEVTPGLQAEAQALAITLDELRLLRALQDSAIDTLEDGLSGAQVAREELAVAIADRSDLPQRFAEDPVATALLLASAETLGGFAEGLAGTVSEDFGGPVPDALGLKGSLALPVDGVILRRADEADAAGVARPGWLVATPPRALVTAPVAGTLRYQGPLLDFGTVVILEPANGTLFVFAGLAEAYGSAGDVLPGGAAVGLMGGDVADAQAILTESMTGAGASRSETLYIEVREGDAPVDPATWFGVE